MSSPQDRILKLERQVQDLFTMLETRGINLIKCAICGKVLPNGFYVQGPEFCWTNGYGIPGVALKDGEHTRYYCVEHLPEALEDAGEWDSPDKERAEYTIAAWLLRYPHKSTPQRTVGLMSLPMMKGCAADLVEEMPRHRSV